VITVDPDVIKVLNRVRFNYNRKSYNFIVIFLQTVITDIKNNKSPFLIDAFSKVFGERYRLYTPLCSN